MRAKLLTPGYSKSVQHVIRNAVRYSIIMGDYPSYLLRNASHREEAGLNDDGFPSWVPRFDRKQDLLVDAEVLVEHASTVETTKTDRALAEELGPPNVLMVRGAVLDVIQNPSPVFDTDTLEDYDGREKLFTSTLNILLPYEGQQSRLARTLIADTNDLKLRSTE